MRIQVEIHGVDDAKRILTRVQEDKLRDEVLDDIGAVMLNRTRTRYLAEQNPEYEKWKPSQAALDRKRLGLGGGTLYETGNLFHSIRLSEPKRFHRSISSETDYGAQHQLGRGQVQRQFIGAGQKDRQVIRQITDTRVLEVLRNG